MKFREFRYFEARAVVRAIIDSREISQNIISRQQRAKRSDEAREIFGANCFDLELVLKLFGAKVSRRISAGRPLLSSGDREWSEPLSTTVDDDGDEKSRIPLSLSLFPSLSTRSFRQGFQLPRDLPLPPGLAPPGPCKLSFGASSRGG